MSRWKQWISPPEGALPGGIVTKAGVALIAVLVAGLLFSWAVTGSGDPASGPPTAPEAQAVGDGMRRSLEGRIRAETERQAQHAAVLARAELERRQEAATEQAAQAESAAIIGSGIGSAESELQETLRLEELERRTRSLRSQPVARSYRNPNASAGPSARPSDSPNSTDDGAGVDPHAVDAALQAALTSLERSVTTLEGELVAEPGLFGAPQAAGAAPRQASPMRQASSSTASQAEPARSVRPRDPPGSERIYEGSFLEAVLVTQLSGDFPGPVLATVSVPFYSADRQRILIPRGTRAVGTAQAVQDRDQSRLAIGFHRLLFPDGRWIDLEFGGLNQAGEAALKDQVDRHYFSTFAAAGSVGVLSGLTLAGSTPYGLQAGAGQGLGQSAVGILDRFLNRLPTITIRAGHRLRIWFTSDVLVPRPPARP